MEINGSLAPLACPCFVSCRKGVEAEAFRLPGEGGDHLHCAVEPSPGHIWCRFFLGDCEGARSLMITTDGSRGNVFTTIQKRPFVHNSVCSQFLEGLFASLAECSQFCLSSF